MGDDDEACSLFLLAEFEDGLEDELEEAAPPADGPGELDDDEFEDTDEDEVELPIKESVHTQNKGKV